MTHSNISETCFPPEKFHSNLNGNGADVASSLREAWAEKIPKGFENFFPKDKETGKGGKAGEGNKEGAVRRKRDKLKEVDRTRLNYVVQLSLPMQYRVMNALTE